MRAKIYITIGNLLLLNFSSLFSQTEVPDSIWTLQKCIQYSLDKNIDVRKSGLTVDKNVVNTDQARSSRFPYELFAYSNTLQQDRTLYRINSNFVKLFISF